MILQLWMNRWAAGETTDADQQGLEVAFTCAPARRVAGEPRLPILSVRVETALALGEVHALLFLLGRLSFTELGTSIMVTSLSTAKSEKLAVEQRRRDISGLARPSALANKSSSNS